MVERSVIRKVEVVSDTKNISGRITNRQICVFVNGQEIIGVMNEAGQLCSNPIVAKLPNALDSEKYLEKLENIMAIAKVQLVKKLDLPGIIIVNEYDEIEGLIHRREIAKSIQVHSERGGLPELAGGQVKVPFVIYVCPKRDYEFIPFDGIPDHLCPTHKLALIPERIVINV